MPPAADPETFIIASIGDTSLKNARPIYEIVKRNNADLLIINGDITYAADPAGLHALLNDIFGEAYPVLITVGNHDTGIYTDYQEVFLERYNAYKASIANQSLSDVEVLRCEGEIGVNQFCSYKNLGFILSGIGSTCMDDAQLNRNLEQQLGVMEENKLLWRSVFIHKNQHLLQTGTKFDEVGYFAYQESFRRGAAVMTAHEHSYARTKQLENVGSRPSEFVIVPEEELEELIDGMEVLAVGPSSSHVVSNGIGGKSFRGARRQARRRPWWQTLFNGDNNNFNYGAHFCEYNVQGRNDLAYCFLETVDGTKADEYFIVSQNRLPDNN